MSKALKVVVIGAGLAGLAAINRLSKSLPNAELILVDKKKEHHYQPGFTLLASGIWNDVNEVIYRNKDYIPSNVRWVQSYVKAFDPDNNQLTTENDEVISYDYMVVATGLRLGYDKIKGLDVNQIGTKGLGSVYGGPEMARKTWDAMEEFTKTGGRAIMTLAPTFMKCSGAPLKMTFMLEDALKRAGRTELDTQINFYSPNDSIFSVPWVSDDVKRRWKDELSISPQLRFWRKLIAIDMDKKIATFEDKEGKTYQEKYDFLHIVPPMFAPDAVLNSKLVVTDGVQKGWLDVNKETLQHNRYPNVFGLGDINGTPRGKTAATIKRSAPIVVHNLLNVINGKKPDQYFNGYTSCPMVLRKGAALLIEFDGDANYDPTFPGVDPLKDSYFAWFIEDLLLKPAYLSVAKGLIK